MAVMGGITWHWCGSDGVHYLDIGVAVMGALPGHWCGSDGGHYLGIGVAVMGGITWALVWQ